MSWIDRGSYWENDCEQCLPGWHLQRKYRVTASNAGQAAGLSPYGTQEELAREIAGIDEKEIPEFNKNVMEKGRIMEPHVRKYYEKERGVKVTEAGLCVPKFDLRIGGSPDGVLPCGKGLLEIKCPYKMYGKILNHMERIERGWKPPPFYHDHIPITHYCQMQMCMAITERDFCDYVVYDSTNDLVFTERIEFNKEFWDFIYGRIRIFLSEMLLPLLENKTHSIPG